MLAGGRLAFVNRTTKMLAHTSATEGGPLEIIGPSIEALDLATDGTSIFGTTLSHETLSAKMLVLGLDGATAPALATWSYAVDDAVGYASVASVVDESRVYWADYHVDDAGRHQATIRSAKR